MLATFQKHITEHFSHLAQEQFVLACSGGIDSMVLTQLCSASQLNFVLAHCNFQLRGTDSDADEEFVRKTATNLVVPFYGTRFNTVTYVNERKVSVQMAARELRYAWFSEIMEQHKIETLVTAHHADDNLETFLINLSRGTGIDGLTGIPANTGIIARPLLCFSRNEIEAYAKANKIAWREDKSNEETKYLRNKIRHHIVPLLKKLHPTFLHNFNQTQQHLADTAHLVKGSIEKTRANLFQEKDGVQTIQIEALQALHPLKAQLYELFKSYGFTAWEDIEKLLSANSGKEVRSKTHRLVKDRNSLLLTSLTPVNREAITIQEGENEITRPIALKIEAVSQILEQGVEVLYVDKKTLKYPLTVRKWKNGDYFYPLGMQGKKKLSKYFKDEKVDVIAKDKQWLLCSGESIIWVIGRRADHRFSVSESTKNIIKISVN